MCGIDHVCGLDQVEQQGRGFRDGDIEDSGGEIAAGTDEEEPGDREHRTHRLEREDEAIGDMIGADVQALAWPFGGKRSQDHQRRGHAADQRRCVAALEFRQSGYETKFGQHHHCDHRRERDRSHNGEELRPSGAPLVGD